MYKTKKTSFKAALKMSHLAPRFSQIPTDSSIIIYAILLLNSCYASYR